MTMSNLSIHQTRPANDDGIVFRITRGGTLTTLHRFHGIDGVGPTRLVQATDGNFYGTTAGGGANHDAGTVFRITPGGTMTTLHSFCAQNDCDDGDEPVAGLVQATDGSLYGTTENGGVSSNCHLGCGTVFRLSVGLGPFVETRPVAGKIGRAVIILGNNLAGSTSVSFNGTPAMFTVVSSSEIATIVPDGATTGKVEVTTPGGTLTSNVKFQIR